MGAPAAAALRCQALGTLDSAGMVKALTPERAPGDPVPEPRLVKKPPQKKKRKKRFWKNKAREVNEKPGSNPTVVAVRPPKAPEDFSQNWKALQEVRREPRARTRTHTPSMPRFPGSPQMENGRKTCGARKAKS